MRRRLPDLHKNINTLPCIESRYGMTLPFVFIASGSIKSGKTFLTLSIIKLMKKAGEITHVHLISPTCNSNVLYQSIINPEVDKVYEDIGPKVFESLKQIEADIGASAQKYADDLAYVIAYRKFCDAQPVTGSDEMLLESRGYKDIGTPKRPSHILVCDDCQGSAIFSRTSKAGAFQNFVLKCRHIHTIGCSIAMISQSFRGGVPRPLRGQASYLALFYTASLTELKSIYDEVASITSWDAFKIAFDFYTRGPHAYLWVNLVTKTLSASF
jgi:hypothetical protein